MTFLTNSRFFTMLSVVFFAWVGMAMRETIALIFDSFDFGQTTTSVEGSTRCVTKSSANSYYLQNALGCMLFAIIARHKTALNEHVAVGLSSGLCGSLTTWATWMNMVAVTLLNGEVVMGLVGVLSMLCVCLSSYKFGHYIAGGGMQGTVPDVLKNDLAKKVELSDASTQCTPTADQDSAEGGEALDGEDWGLALDTPDSWHEQEVKLTQLSFLAHALITAAAASIILCVMAYLLATRNTSGLLSMAMAPGGAILRWALSLGNPMTAPFPAFTLLANTLGCVVDGVSGIMTNTVSSTFEQAAWSAFATGFGGCLSTVSTLISELRSDKLGGLRLRSTYFLTSLACAMGVFLPMYAGASCS